MIDVVCPADGRLVGQVPELGPEEVAVVAARLRAAQPAWEELGPKGRAAHMLRFLEWILDHEGELVGILQDESGKSRGDAMLEVISAVELINYYCKNGPKFLADRKVRPAGMVGVGRRLRVYSRPFQLVGIITPWNGPLGAPLLDGIPAMLAGASVLFKPSEVAPLTWAAATRGWTEGIGGPPVIANVSGGAATGAAVVDTVDMIMFTGSARTGRRVAARAGERLIPASLELGGKDAMIVLADADVRRAARAAVWGAMTNSGQICISVERVYVEQPAYEAFVERVVAEVQRLRQGPDFDGGFRADIGSMACGRQLELVEEHVADAIANGAKVLTGGRRASSGLFYEPTVLVEVDHSMRCMREETFGPTLPIMSVRDDEEAIRLANDSVYGLASSVWTSDPARADRVARRMEAGAVNLNNVMVSTFQFPVPMSGWKESGIGSRAGGAAGILKFCRQQSIVSGRLSFSEPHWYPFGQIKGTLVRRAIRLLGAPTWRTRLGFRPKRSTRTAPSAAALGLKEPRVGSNV